MSEKTPPTLISEHPNDPQSERQQAIVRMLFATATIVFVIYAQLTNMFDDLSQWLILSTVVYFVAALAIILSIIFFPQYRVTVRKSGTIVDLCFITVAMTTGSEVTAFGYGGYLWVTIANGLRFGRRYMKAAQIASIACFSLVLVTTEYWQQNPVLGIGLLVWLILLPVYVARLLRALENTVIKADAANKAKSDFLANMSHEIRTPLTSIIGYAEISLDGRQTPEEHNTALKTIVRSGNHLLNLVNDILDFSKIEA